MELNYRVEGLQEAVDRIQRAGKKLSQLNAWFKIAGLLVLESIQDVIIKGGVPRWPGLKLETLIRRGSKAGGDGLAKPLRDMGLLMNSLEPKVKRSEGIWDRKRTSLAVGTNVPYAKYHQSGEGWMKRPFMVLQPAYEKKITDALNEEVQRILAT